MFIIIIRGHFPLIPLPINFTWCMQKKYTFWQRSILLLSSFSLSKIIITGISKDSWEDWKLFIYFFFDSRDFQPIHPLLNTHTNESNMLVIVNKLTCQNEWLLMLLLHTHSAIIIGPLLLKIGIMVLYVCAEVAHQYHLLRTTCNL